MKCTACGNENAEGTRFCIYCGTPLTAPAPTPEPAAPAVEEIKEEKVNLVLEEAPAADLQQSSFRSEPAPAPVQPAVKPRPFRDGRGKYIVKRLIFFGCALAIWILGVFLLKGAVPDGGYGWLPPDIFNRLLPTLILLLVPIIIAFIISMFVGLAKGAKAKSVIRIISAVLRAMVPFSLSLMLIYLLAFKAGWFPIMYMGSIETLILPVLTLTLPLTGYLMNAAVSNGRKPGFAGSIGAVAACLADHMIIIVIAEMAMEMLFAVPGLCTMMIQMIYSYNFGPSFVAVGISLGVLVYLLKLLNDVIASLCAGGDPSDQVYGERDKSDKAGKVLLLVGIIFAAVIVVAAIVLPLFAKESLTVVSSQNNLPAGASGHILGTDTFGRDLFDVMAAALRNTMIAGLVNTIVACIIGGIFGILAGFIRNWAAEIFKGFRYVFGYGAPLTIMILAVLLGVNSLLTTFVVVGMYCWGGIADRVAGVIRARKSHAYGRTAIALPILEQIVQTFCTSMIGVIVIGFLGLARRSQAFPTFGQLLSDLRSMIGRNDVFTISIFLVVTLMFTGFYLLHAGLSAKEKYTFK